LGKILKEPDAPWIALFKGMGATACAIGLPILIPVLFAPREGSDGFWVRFVVCITIIGTMSLIAGIARAVWACIQRWAYDRVTDDPFH
jgi:hypothetical protein